MENVSSVGLNKTITSTTSLKKKNASVKAFLTNETTQKTILFLVIISLIIIAANLENIV